MLDVRWVVSRPTCASTGDNASLTAADLDLVTNTSTVTAFAEAVASVRPHSPHPARMAIVLECMYGSDLLKSCLGVYLSQY